MAGKSADADRAGRGLDPLEGRRGPAGLVSPGARSSEARPGLPETLGGLGRTVLPGWSGKEAGD